MTFPILLQQLSGFLNARQHSKHMRINHVHKLGMSDLLGMDWEAFPQHVLWASCAGLTNHVWDCPRPWHLKSGNSLLTVKALNSAGYSPQWRTCFFQEGIQEAKLGSHCKLPNAVILFHLHWLLRKHWGLSSLRCGARARPSL